MPLTLSLLEYHTNNNTKISLQDLADLLSVYAELGQEDKVNEVVQQIRNREQGVIFTRSKYFITTGELGISSLYSYSQTAPLVTVCTKSMSKCAELLLPGKKEIPMMMRITMSEN
jgi:hypothetical protein